MKKLFIPLLTSVALTVALSSISVADESLSLSIKSVGKKSSSLTVLSKQEYIEQLTPQPVVKLRGVKLRDGVSAKTVAPSVSMQINFQFDSAVLTQQSKRQLQPLGEALMSDQLLSYRFNIAGHTDATGLASYNQTLSGQRAVAVGQYLYDTFDINPERLELIGHGEEQLMDDTQPEAAINRRVEITTLLQ